ncbi:membrane protein [Arenicella chitinivorans]|uniref:Membrane protein n=1 Tax=Arenicella chitinivorans TaxID=1329800 RepID=A0A918VN73_9GAMM|nr:hypothetical protein [Arenicella chitinivorans]GHA14572.1 membrane protein [Arenicella chitinivorans]
MRFKLALFAAIAIATAVYPFVVYTGLNAFGPASLSLVLFALLLGRVVLRGQYRMPEQYAQLALVGSLCLLAAWRDSETILRYYPVAMSLGFSIFFAISLCAETSLVERFASLRVTRIEPHQKRYMRELTKAWSLLLLVNAGVAAYTACCLSLAQWTLYNGAIAYIIFGLFALAELVFRHFYKKRYAQNNQNEPPSSS